MSAADAKRARAAFRLLAAASLLGACGESPTPAGARAAVERRLRNYEGSSDAATVGECTLGRLPAGDRGRLERELPLENPQSVTLARCPVTLVFRDEPARGATRTQAVTTFMVHGAAAGRWFFWRTEL